MSFHKLERGQYYIEWIKALGKILEYHVQLELPVEHENLDRSPAVDIAWFKEKGQRFPLFIFEVESAATNAMAYNPLKVFSKRNEKFEKPLFFFQVIVNRGQSSSRVKDLREQFGSYNFRIYRFSTNEKQSFLFDVLAQHRRLSGKLKVSELFHFIIKDNWLGINLDELALHIEKLEFERVRVCS